MISYWHAANGGHSTHAPWTHWPVDLPRTYRCRQHLGLPLQPQHPCFLGKPLHNAMNHPHIHAYTLAGAFMCCLRKVTGLLSQNTNSQAQQLRPKKQQQHSCTLHAVIMHAPCLACTPISAEAPDSPQSTSGRGVPITTINLCWPGGCRTGSRRFSSLHQCRLKIHASCMCTSSAHVNKAQAQGRVCVCVAPPHLAGTSTRRCVLCTNVVKPHACGMSQHHGFVVTGAMLTLSASSAVVLSGPLC